MITVFVAEDDVITAKLYAMHFKRNEIAGIFYQTGNSLLEAAALHRPQAVILDLELPDLPGMELMHRLHGLSACSDLPVIFVTGKTVADVAPGLLEAGASAVFGKPFSPVELIERIRTLARDPA